MPHGSTARHRTQILADEPARPGAPDEPRKRPNELTRFVTCVGVRRPNERHYAAVKTQLTPERLKAEFGNLLRGPIRRYEIDHLGALNFVMDEGLEGGVNQSLNLDSHGKSWSFLLLGLEVEVED